MANNVSFEKKKLLEGLDILYRAVAPSLGPRAYSAVLDDGFRRRVIDDGVEIARRVILADKVQNAGANIVAEAARKTADEAGDGTTATIILAHAIIHESLKLIASGTHPMALRKGLEEGIELLISEVDKIKTPITTLDESIQIATISCKDEKLGKLIAETVNTMGPDGIVTVEESRAPETYIDYQKGMRFESGYAHPAFVTHPENMEAIYTNPKLLIMDKAVSFEGLLPLFGEIQKKGLALVIIAPTLEARMGEFLIENKRKGAIQVLYINAPYAANFQKDFLQDIAILTGANYIALTEGSRIEDINFNDLGECEKIITNKNSTIIQEGKGDKAQITERIDAIKALTRSTPSDFESEKFKERLAKLTTGIAVIKIGGATEVEMNERRERAIDAVAAVKAAKEDGVVIGGERAYFQLRKALDQVHELKHILNPDSGLSKEDIERMQFDEKDALLVKGDVRKAVSVIQIPLSKEVLEAFDILKIAIQKPFEKLMDNSGLNVGEYMEKLRNVSADMGVDAATGEIVNMREKGIIDPAKVVKCALRNAVSVAIQFLTINVIITPGEPVKK